MPKLKNYNYYLKIINQIQKIRSKNNLNWMGLLKLSFKHAPKEAIKLVKKYDRKELSNYYINDFIKFIGMSKKKFQSIMKKYTNTKIWKIKGNQKTFINNIFQKRRTYQILFIKKK